MKRFIAILLIILLVLPLSPLVVKADSYNLVNNISDPKTRNAYKIWSVAKCAGMTDEEAAGLIGNAEVESNIDSTVLEGTYSDPYTMDVTWKQNALHDLCSYTRNTVFANYKSNGWTIKGSQDSYGHSVAAVVGRDHTITTSAYIGNGHYLPGMGVFQFTGPVAAKLISFGNSIDRDWYDMDTQLIYTFCTTGEFQLGRAGWILENYATGQYKTPEQCAYHWYWVFEAGKSETTFNVGVYDKSAEQRQANARKWYNEFKNNRGDVTYGTRILTEANYPISFVSSNEIKDRSIAHSYSSPVIQFPRGNGFAFDVTGEADTYAKNASIALLASMPEYATNGSVDVSDNPTLQKKYSLYDLFGSDIHWYRYYGESTQTIKLLDHLWSGIVQDKTDQLIGSWDAIKNTVFYTSTTYLSCNVYSGRPTVLTVQELDEGKTDPRTSSITINRFNGMQYVAGGLYMSLAKGITSLISYLMGPEPMHHLRTVVDFIIDNDIWHDVAVPMVMIIVAISIIFFVLSFVGKSKRYAVGQTSFREILKRFLMGLLSLGVIFVFAARPGAMSDIFEKGATIVDDLFNSILTMANVEDDVVGSTDGTKTTEAMIWRTTIFEPWCLGQFGRRYDELYTQYADVEDDKKMPQSCLTDEEVENIPDGEYKYNSAAYTGDVVVPVGNNTYIRNWAAYLYSCQSKYHIDHEYTTGLKTPTEEINFPNASTTAYNTSVYADTFRVIDARMDISPQIYPDSTIANYTGASLPKSHFGTQGRLMLLYAIILTITFVPAIFMKLKNLALLFFTCIQAIFYGIIELAKEGTGLNNIFSKLKTYAINYVLAALKLFILTILFTTLVGQSLIQTMLYCFISLAVYGLTYKDMKEDVSRAKNKVKNGWRALKNRI